MKAKTITMTRKQFGTIVQGLLTALDVIRAQNHDCWPVDLDKACKLADRFCAKLNKE